MRGRGLSVVHTREPGGTRFAEAIRHILLDPSHEVQPLAELLLYEAARAQHTQERLLPALKKGSTVVCERFTLATLVYQGAGRGIPTTLIRKLNRIATDGLKPDLTIVLDVPDREFHRRQSKPADRLELESRKFRDRVREGYRRFARSEPKTALIDAARPLKAVHQDIWARAERNLPLAPPLSRKRQRVGVKA